MTLFLIYGHFLLAVKLSQVLVSMDENTVGAVHDIRLTLYRDESNKLDNLWKDN
jgi:hypothetical protein